MFKHDFVSIEDYHDAQLNYYGFQIARNPQLAAAELEQSTYTAKRKASEDEFTPRSAKRMKVDNESIRQPRRSILKRVKNVARLVKASPAKRAMYAQSKRLDFEEGLEEHRRLYPGDRPDYQKIFLVEKQKQMHPGTGFCEYSGAEGFQKLITFYDGEPQAIAGDADSFVSSQAPTESGKSMSGNCFTMNEAERERARIQAYIQSGVHPRELRGGSLSRVEKMAIGFSKVLDPFKSATDDDGDLEMFDVAPVEMLDVCEVCHEPTQSYLTNGMCRVCQINYARRSQG